MNIISFNSPIKGVITEMNISFVINKNSLSYFAKLSTSLAKRNFVEKARNFQHILFRTDALNKASG